jgi:predicted lysophospholipase L1 biosynthesis ABC-type transport system permease subunit
MGVTVLRGREFTKWDMAQSPGVVIVDEELERRFFADRPALGAHLRLQYDVPGPREVEIVGVARQVKHDDLNEPPAATVYIPMTQVPQEMLGFVSPRVQLVVRGTGPAMADVVRREVRGLDAQVPISGVRTLQSLVDAAVAPRKFGAGLLSGFALAALLLAASGIYAVAAYSVSQRTREIGVRMALGATARDVVRLVVTESARPVMLGLLGGLIAAAIAARASSALLYSVTALDASSFAAGVAALGASALLASWWPARRATRVDPVIALRS